LASRAGCFAIEDSVQKKNLLLLLLLLLLLEIEPRFLGHAPRTLVTIPTVL